ncbi:MAG: shikimate dehydrogenase, partial [Burkholderiales bacterium]|nr:shikimate dehydrogenase [Burkholderiales bacterium]
MRHFAVIGNPITHSRSPEIHQAFAEQTGIAIAYRRLEAPVTADDSGFTDVARAFFADGGVGMNVTAPFKDAAFRFASDVSERSRLAAAANTLTAAAFSASPSPLTPLPQEETNPRPPLAGTPFGKEASGWHADNTDGVGLVRDLTGRLGLSLAGQRLLILGAGGATAGILEPLLDARPSQIVLWNRSADKAQRLVHRFAAAYPDAALSAVSDFSGELDQGTFDLVIHATSLKVAVPMDNESPPLQGAVAKAHVSLLPPLAGEGRDGGNRSQISLLCADQPPPQPSPASGG